MTFPTTIMQNQHSQNSSMKMRYKMRWILLHGRAILSVSGTLCLHHTPPKHTYDRHVHTETSTNTDKRIHTDSHTNLHTHTSSHTCKRARTWGLTRKEHMQVHTQNHRTNTQNCAHAIIGITTLPCVCANPRIRVGKPCQSQNLIYI